MFVFTKNYLYYSTVDVFILKLIFSFIVGSIWITYATILAEKFGSKIGGVLAGMPSTVVIALFFIGWTQNPLAASQATTMVPVVMGISAIFIVIYALLSRFNFILAIVISLAVWFVLALTLVANKFDNFSLSLICFVILLAFSYLMVEHVFQIKSMKGQKYTAYFNNLVVRGLLSGSVIVVAVLGAKFGGPLVGGAFASFPAVMLATIIITHLAQGRTFSLAVIKTLMLSGCTNVVIYATVVRYFYPLFGLILGTVLSFLLSLVLIYFVYQGIKRTA